MYPKVVASLTELRTMTEEYTKQVLQIQDIEPDVISPLIMEMVSNMDWTHQSVSEATLALAQALNIDLSMWNTNMLLIWNSWM